MLRRVSKSKSLLLEVRVQGVEVYRLVPLPFCNA